MAISCPSTNDRLQRVSGDFLTNTQDFTIAFWAQVSAFGAYQTLQLLSVGAVNYDVDTWLGTFVDNAPTSAIYVERYPSVFAETSPRALGTWYYVTMRWQFSTQRLSVSLAGIEQAFVITNLTTIAGIFTQEFLGADGLGGNDTPIALAYYRSWQAYLTDAELATEQQATSAVRTANLFCDTPLTTASQLADLSGNGRDWSAVGSPVTFTGTGPLAPNPSSSTGSLLLSGDSNTTDMGLYAYNTTTGQWASYSLTQLSEYGALARRPSDGHVFIFTETGVVQEYTPTLVYVQTFGVPDTSDPASLFPSNAAWIRGFIQFIGSSVYLGWSGFSGNLGNIAVQQRDGTTFATGTQHLAFAGALPGSSNWPLFMSPNGAVLYFKSTLGAGADQNHVYSYTIATTTVASFAFYHLWNGGTQTGDIVQDVRTLSNGHVVAMFTKLTTGVSDGAHIVVYSAVGAELLDFSLDSVPDPPLVVTVDLEETGIWVTGTFDDTVPDVIQHYPLIDGAGPDIVFNSLNSIATNALGRLLVIPAIIAPVIFPSSLVSPWTPVLVQDGSPRPPIPPPPGPTVTVPMRQLRRSPHYSTEQVRTICDVFQLDCAQGTGTPANPEPEIDLRYSTDGGYSWSMPIPLTPGAAGDYVRQCKAFRLGQGRNWVFEVSTTNYTGPWIAAYVNMRKGTS